MFLKKQFILKPSNILNAPHFLLSLDLFILHFKRIALPYMNNKNVPYIITLYSFIRCCTQEECLPKVFNLIELMSLNVTQKLIATSLLSSLLTMYILLINVMNRDKLLCCNKVLIGFSVYIDLFARQQDDE